MYPDITPPWEEALASLSSLFTEKKCCGEECSKTRECNQKLKCMAAPGEIKKVCVDRRTLTTG